MEVSFNKQKSLSKAIDMANLQTGRTEQDALNLSSLFPLQVGSTEESNRHRNYTAKYIV